MTEQQITITLPNGHPMRARWLLQARYDAGAAEDSWHRVLAFFQQVFSGAFSTGA